MRPNPPPIADVNLDGGQWYVYIPIINIYCFKQHLLTFINIDIILVLGVAYMVINKANAHFSSKRKEKKAEKPTKQKKYEKIG